MPALRAGRGITRPRSSTTGRDRGWGDPARTAPARRMRTGVARGLHGEGGALLNARSSAAQNEDRDARLPAHHSPRDPATAQDHRFMAKGSSPARAETRVRGSGRHSRVEPGPRTRTLFLPNHVTLSGKRSFAASTAGSTHVRVLLIMCSTGGSIDCVRHRNSVDNLMFQLVLFGLAV